MATSAQAAPHNPLRTFRFQIAIDDPGRGTRGGDKWIAGVQRVSGLSVTVAANETWEGGNNLHRYATPHRVSWDSITLEQGLALDRTLEDWARAVLQHVRRGGIKPVESDRKRKNPPVKRNLIIRHWDFKNPVEFKYRVFNAWISKYQPMPNLDAMSSEVGLLSVEITHEGWTVERIIRPPSKR